MFEKSSQSAQECIFFIDDSGVTQEMMYTEFEAILDGVVGLTDYANTTAYCVFAVINPGLQVKALVFFTVEFDDKGEPPIDWNVPFQSLIQKSATVHIGSFDAKMVSRSACAVEWHRDSLWDPSEEVIGFLESAIDLNKLCLATTSMAESFQQQAVPSFANKTPMNFSQPGVVAQISASQPPQGSPQTSLPDLVQEVAQQLSGADRELSNSVKTLSADLHQMTIRSNQFEEKYLEAREQLLQQKTDYTKKIETLQNSIENRIQTAVAESKTALKQKFEKKLKNYEQEYKTRYTTKVSEIKTSASATTQALQDKSTLIAEKDELLQEKKAKLEVQKSKIEEQELALSQKTELLEQLEVTVKKLSEELAGFRKEKLRLMANGADKFFERLEKSGLNFIAFHPGAGHVSVSVSRVAEYLENPPAFAADKVGLSEEAYLYWLNHYEKPCCEAPIMGGTTCGQKIKRHENPKDFMPGISDRCDKHRTGVSAQGRVFSS